MTSSKPMAIDNAILFLVIGIVGCLWAAEVISWSYVWRTIVFTTAFIVILGAISEIKQRFRPKPPGLTAAELGDALKRLAVEREKAEAMLAELKKLRVSTQPEGGIQ
jgi:hypothetical protein